MHGKLVKYFFKVNFIKNATIPHVAFAGIVFLYIFGFIRRLELYNLTNEMSPLPRRSTEHVLDYLKGWGRGGEGMGGEGS